mgnify:CR=1 FL=1
MSEFIPEVAVFDKHADAHDVEIDITDADAALYANAEVYTKTKK